MSCRLVPSRAARKLRMRVRTNRIEVVVPSDRTDDEALAFVAANHRWASEQLARSRRLASFRRPERRPQSQVSFRGESVPVRIVQDHRWRAPNQVRFAAGRISITCGSSCATLPSRTLEIWLRKQARSRIEKHVDVVAKRIKQSPGRIYVMGQRTKWGNCSALGNLSFNWRLIMAPDFVLRYIVTHEVVHLAVPDHSRRFWLTVQSLCPESDRARQWLVAHGERLMANLARAIDP